MSGLARQRSLSADPTRSPSRHLSSLPNSPVNPPSPPVPTQTFHPASIIVPTPGLLESVAGAAHYSGIKVESHEAQVAKKKHRRSSGHHGSADLTTVNADHQRILDDLKELYCCRPSLEIFDRSWRQDAIFEDPLCICRGYAEYAAQFYAMSKLFSKSETLSSRTMSSTVVPNRIVYQQRQEYTTRFLKKKKVVDSIIIVELDEDDKIVRLTDQWDGKPMPTWFGSGMLRILNAKVTPWLVHVPKKSA